MIHKCMGDHIDLNHLTRVNALQEVRGMVFFSYYLAGTDIKHYATEKTPGAVDNMREEYAALVDAVASYAMAEAVTTAPKPFTLDGNDIDLSALFFVGALKREEQTDPGRHGARMANGRVVSVRYTFAVRQIGEACGRIVNADASNPAGIDILAEKHEALLTAWRSVMSVYNMQIAGAA